MEAKLFSTFREKSIGVAGIVKTSKIYREEKEMSEAFKS